VLVSVVVPDETLYKTFLSNLVLLAKEWKKVHFGFYCDLPTRQIDLTLVYCVSGNSTEHFLEEYAKCEGLFEETEEDPINLEMD
jgi:hypothetical protein